MATVRLSRELIANIITALRAPYYARLESEVALPMQKAFDAAPIREALAQMMCAEHKLHRDQYETLPETLVRRVTVCYVGKVNGQPLQGGTQRVDLNPPLPVSFSVYSGTPPRLDPEGPELDSLLAKQLQLAQHSADIRQQMVQAERAVSQLLGAVTTLKQALDAYPPLQRWVPQHALDQMAVPASKKERIKAVREKVDVSALTQALLRERVG